jgi:hypothetical protein
MRYVTAFVLVAAWIEGIVLAAPGWYTALAYCFPLYAWYVVAERVTLAMGWLTK